MHENDIDKIMMFISIIIGFSIMTLSIWSGDIISNYVGLSGFGRYFIMYFSYWLVRTFIRSISEKIPDPNDPIH